MSVCRDDYPSAQGVTLKYQLPDKLLHIGQHTQHSVQDCHIYSDMKYLMC